MKTDIRIILSVCLTAAFLTGCDDGDPVEQVDDASDSVQQDGSDAIDGVDDTQDSGDTLTDAGDTTPDTDIPDTGETDGETTVVCDAAAYEAAVEEALSPADTAVDSDLITFSGDNSQSATVEAGLGGPAQAAESSWIYLDLNGSAQIEESDDTALTTDVWDVAFNRTKIRLNSGDSGPGNWLVTRLDETSWDDAYVPGRDSGAEYAEDDFVDDDTCEISSSEYAGVDTAFGQWYAYDMETHSVSAPEDTVFVLYNQSTHETLRFQIQSYDQETGTYEIRWDDFEDDSEEECDAQAAAAEAIGAQSTAAESGLITSSTTDGVSSATIEAGLGGTDAADSSSWVYLDLQTGNQVDISDEASLTDDVWDIAFKRTGIRLNGADSGAGALYVGKLTETTWETAEVPSRDSGVEYKQDDFVDDETCEVDSQPYSGVVTAFGQWYAYDMETHQVSAPEGVVYVLYQFTDHSTRRFQIQSYNDGTYDVRWAGFPDNGGE